MDRGLCALFTACGRGGDWVVLDDGRRRNGSTGQPPGASILTATGRRVSPCVLCECWPPEHNIIPRQPMDKVRALITQCLDEDATRKP